MKKFIKHLQKQPREVKSHAAFIGAIAVTVLVAFVWMTTLPARFSTVAEGIDVRDNVAELAESVKSELPIPPPPIKEQTDAERLETSVDSLLEDIRKKRAGIAASARTATSSSASSTMPAETATATPPTSTQYAGQASSSPGRPVLIEVR